jgi:hypothetical protein
MKKLIIICILFLMSSTSLAYEGDPETQVENFFKDLSSGNVNEAIDSLYSSNPLMNQKIQELTLMKQQVAMISTLFGKHIGVEEYSNELLTPSITKIVKVEKFENHPVVWEFFFYKPHDKWIISKGTFNDQFGSLK